MYIYQDDHYVFTDDYYKFAEELTGGFDTNPTGTTLFRGVTLLTIISDKQNANFPASNAGDIQDQFVEFLSSNTTETTLTITFLDGIDSLFLANINFSSFKITVDGVDSTIAAFKNPNTGRYNGICFFDGSVDSLTLTITAQTPVDSASYFSIGAIVGGDRITLDPRYEASRRIVEPSDILRFDENNKEVNNSARTYHTFNINFKDTLIAANMISLKQLENSIGMDGVIIVYEKYSDRETGILGERTGSFNYSEKSVSRFDNILSIKEKV